MRSESEAVDSISAVLTLSAGSPGRRDRGARARGTADHRPVHHRRPHGRGSPASAQVATDLLRLFSPQLLAYGAISLMTAVLNAVRRFTVPAFAPILNNIVAIGVLLEFAAAGHTHSLAEVQHDHGLLLLLGIGTTLGVVVQAAALVPSMLRCGLRLRPRWRPSDPAVREIINLSGWTFGFVIANQIAVFVVSAIAVSIGAATITAYTYAFTFFQLPFGIVAVSIMTTIAPVLASALHERETSPASPSSSDSGFAACLRACIPASVGYLLLARPAISLISRGAGSVQTSSGAQLHGIPARDCLPSACPDTASTCWRSAGSRRRGTPVRRSSSTCWRTA